jgi:transposase
MPNATFSCPDLDSFCLLDRLGLSVTGQHVRDDHAVLACRVLEPDDWCHQCGAQGVPRDTVLRELAHVPLGWRPTILQIRVRRYRCTGCGHVWRQDTEQAAAPRVKLSRHAVLWALKCVVIDRLSIARVAANLGASWHTVNDAVLAAGHQLLIGDPHRLDGVRVLGVDEHAWRHTRRGDKYVTVIIDLTPVRDGTGPSRLLDMVEGRSKQVFKTWLEAQTAQFRSGIEVVAMDGFTGFKTAASEELPDAVAVMDPFHVVAVRHEALCVRAEVRDHRRRGVVAPR